MREGYPGRVSMSAAGHRDRLTMSGRNSDFSLNSDVMLSCSRRRPGPVSDSCSAVLNIVSALCRQGVIFLVSTLVLKSHTLIRVGT